MVGMSGGWSEGVIRSVWRGEGDKWEGVEG